MMRHAQAGPTQRYDIIIPARGGSVEIPRKNLAIIGDKPLVAWAIEVASRAPFSKRVIVSTDDSEIAEVAQHYGAEVPYMRPAHLALGSVHSVHTVLHHLDWCEEANQVPPTGVFMLLPTNLFRTGQDLDNMVAMMTDNPQASSIVGATLDGNVMRGTRHIHVDGHLTVPEFLLDQPRHQSRQDTPNYCRINGCAYLASPASLRQHESYIHGPWILPYLMSAFSGIDIDTQEDLIIARHMIPVLETALSGGQSFALADHAD